MLVYGLLISGLHFWVFGSSVFVCCICLGLGFVGLCWVSVLSVDCFVGSCLQRFCFTLPVWLVVLVCLFSGLH